MKIFACLLTFIVCVEALGQTQISGTATQPGGEPIPFANVLIENSYDGTTADENGKFVLKTSEKGEHTLIVRAIGFKDFVQVVTLTGATVRLQAILKEQINELQAVTISAGSFTASDESRRTVFSAVDIASTAGATADIAGALNTLPGTQKVGESGRLFVRGGDGNETKTFIDGMLVFDAYGPAAPNTPSRGRFLPFMFKGSSFSTGGYSAEYGQALSSALVLDSKDNTEVPRTDIGIMSVGGDVAHTRAWDRGSLAGKIQYTNLRPYVGLINQEIDWQKAPVSAEGVTAFRQKVGKAGMLKFYGNFNRSDFSLHSHDVDDYDVTRLLHITNDYRYANASYKDVLNTNWVLKTGLSYSLISNSTSIDAADLKERERGVHAKFVLDGSLSEQISLRTGSEVVTRNYSFSGTDGFDETIPSAFAEADFIVTNDFVIRTGVRSEYNSLQEVMSFDPRISFAHRLGETGQLSLAAGRFTQSVKNEWLRSDNHLQSEKAQHLILNYQKIEDGKTFRIETYYKDYSKLLTFSPEARLSNNGTGYARGLELFWRDKETIRFGDYWISYSFLDTRRRYLQFNESVTPAFASAHNLSVVYKHFFKELKSQLGVTWSYASGRSYYDPGTGTMSADQTPAYQDLSANWSYLPRQNVIVHLSCTNLLGRDNIFGYEYGNETNEHGVINRRPVRQAAPRFIFLGVFITLSKHKNINQLPTL